MHVQQMRIRRKILSINLHTKARRIKNPCSLMTRLSQKKVRLRRILNCVFTAKRDLTKKKIVDIRDYFKKTKTKYTRQSLLLKGDMHL